MKTTIFILGDNNFWYHTAEVTYNTNEELQTKINDALSEVRNGITNGAYETETDASELHVVVGEFMHTNLSA